MTMVASSSPPRAAQGGNGNRPAENLPAIAPPRLPFHPLVEDRFGIDRASWKALVEAIFPNAQTVESVILALSYCRARKLDPFKRNVHIVPIWNRDQRCMVDTIWPGIGELRTTAFRTGQYAGRDDAQFGPTLDQKVGEHPLKFPEWCRVTVYRICGGQRVAFSGPKVYWLETYATAKRDSDTPNEMWATRPMGQIEKCAEAAALRAAFPEEIGSDAIADEIAPGARGKHVESTTVEERGTSGLLNKLRGTDPLPDTQLPDDEAAKELAKREQQPQSPVEEAAQGQTDTSGIGDEPGEPNPTPAATARSNGGSTAAAAPASEDAEIAIKEAITGSWDEVRANLRNVAKAKGMASKADFESGVVKFLVARKVLANAAATAPVDVPAKNAALMRELYGAITAGTFDFKSGAILNPNAD